MTIVTSIPNRYYLGVDAGGTKTHALIADESGSVAGFGQAGPGNWEGVGLDGLTQSLSESISEALENSGLTIGDISSAGMGLAGYDWPSQRSMLLEAIKPVGLECPVEIVNDATLGIFAGASQGWGISVVSGTGCNCRGWSKDLRREGRVVGGGSYWSGEFAGGFDIAARAMQAVTFEWNKRGPATALTPAFIELMGATDLDDLIEGVYVGRYDLSPETIMLVFKIASEGDDEAQNVMRWAGDQLGQLACGVVRQLHFEHDKFDVILIGSLFEGHPLMKETMGETIRKLAPDARIVRLNAPPVVGGVVLAMQVGGLDTQPIRENLIASMAERTREV
jgi:N-acetylglucosamine kinase-like BadF-type ATPase